mmetsp:Transcript_38822/g.84498  ORF Transcript_38822/g.84498 Transcript_38822/m.84498 type:complete len:205 (-) Transcript_38822:237-851(-)
MATKSKKVAEKDPSKACTDADLDETSKPRVHVKRESKRTELLEVPDEPPTPAIEQLLANDKQKKLVVARPEYGPCGTPSVLSRLQTFLPEMSEANKSLFKRLEAEGASTLDIEEISDEAAPHIAMDLQCGVLDLKTKDAAAKAAQHVGSEPVPLKSSHQDEEEEEDLEDFISSASDSSDDDCDEAEHADMGKSKHPKRPIIEEL